MMLMQLLIENCSLSFIGMGMGGNNLQGKL